MLRRHSDTVAAFNEAWWDEICRGSRRDQLSFDYTARKLGLRYGHLPGTIADNPLFQRRPHVTERRELATVPPPGERVVRTPALRATPARKTIAFGPLNARPSWGWVGYDMARELSKTYDVILYDADAPAVQCDVLFAIKKRPAERLLDGVERQGSKLVYCPVDVYDATGELQRDAEFLARCAMVLVHCERMLPLLRPHCAQTHFVEHHSRFATHAMAEYQRDGFILWIGAYAYVPYLADWLARHPIDSEVRILTDFDNEKSRRKADQYAAEIGMDIASAAAQRAIAGCRMYQWSERRQGEMMRACRAALDVKLTTLFSQQHKPPTKAQQYIASGIPFAVNADSYSAEYFLARGFELASPLDTERWWSHDYWQETRATGQALRAATALERVGEHYRKLIESL
ncbi:MAG: hypothetical protein ABI629_06140 [bacterium]